MATCPAALGGGLRGAAGVRLARVRTMGLSELLCRSRQLAWSNLDRIAARTTVRRARQLLGGLARSAGVGGRAPRRERDVARGAERLLERFRESVPERFFSGAVSADTAAMLFERMPEAAESVRASADAVSRGRFDLLGYRQLSFGDPLDWHLDPTSGRRVPLKYWSPLRGVEEPEVGDCKVVWELNRHQWLVGLAQAYVLTADDAYASRLVDHIREWMRANPRGVGVNWASSLEVALRLISWCWALSLVRQSKALSAEFFLEALRGVAAHGSQVERYLSYYFSPNTHLTGEALGLFYAGIVFPGLRHAERWRALGTRILIEQLERQVTADGVYFEQSTCYQRYTVEIYLHFLILAARNAIAVPRVVHERVQRMLDFLLAVRRPDGTMPQIGDADGGWLLPLASRMPDDLRGIFSTAASVFGRSDYAWAGGGPAPETVWLLGRAGLERLETLAPAPPTAPGSTPMMADDCSRSNRLPPSRCPTSATALPTACGWKRPAAAKSWSRSSSTPELTATRSTRSGAMSFGAAPRTARSPSMASARRRRPARSRGRRDRWRVYGAGSRPSGSITRMRSTTAIASSRIRSVIAAASCS